MGYLNSDGLETQIQYIKSYVEDEMKKHASIPIGHEYFSMNPNVPDGSLPMLGGVYDRSIYADLWDWVQTQTGYLITDSAWVTLSNSQNGNVPFYSSGDGSTTFRVPSLKCWIKGTDGVETVGTYLDAGLPNIEGYFGGVNFVGTGPDGAFVIDSEVGAGAGGSHFGIRKINFYASESNSIYGNSTTVVPESIVGMWLVKAYGTVVDTGTIDEQAYIDEQLALNVPTGCVQAFAGQTTPQGWLLCDGSAYSRTDYAALFAVIGTTYGTGDGSTTFNVPNLVDKFIEGAATAGTVKAAGLPNIKARVFMGVSTSGLNMFYTPAGSGAFASQITGMSVQMGKVSTSGTQATSSDLTFDASRHNSIYKDDVSTVQPPSLTMRYIIKY